MQTFNINTELWHSQLYYLSTCDRQINITYLTFNCFITSSQ
uniref:Uncharacterized protein n=2 Tax=Anguilla anguilla TaxID=7936 RepID=A0A0E9UHW6_ANGAN